MNRPTPTDALATGRSYREACVLLAAAELRIFDSLAKAPLDASALAASIGGDRRATTILADALVALGILEKGGDRYALPPDSPKGLLSDSPETVLPMLWHQANCLRSWARLAETVASGRPAPRTPSVRGAEEDGRAFIEAMAVGNREHAARVVAALGPHRFRRLLDVGGGPGTWTIAFLEAAPEAEATIYDLPDVLPIARRHVEAAGLSGRVRFAGGSFRDDDGLPGGADFAWVSAIVHMNSREQNRDLFRKVRAALEPGGEIVIRDVVMDDDHVHPPDGALFAVNMLVNTEGGGTFTFGELAEDLEAAGFEEPRRTSAGERSMDSVVRATRP